MHHRVIGILSILLTGSFWLSGCSPAGPAIDVEVPDCNTVASCRDGDACCPPACTSLNDSDCLPECGNGILEAGEVCDRDCPADCDDGNACTADNLEGQVDDCSAACRHSPVEECLASDGCCPAGCNQVSDPDCSATCGNGFIEQGESCDGDCPSDCNDHNPCSLDRLTGSAANCSAACYHQRIDGCLAGDGCCPAGCSSLSDSDCSPSCGNGLIENGETCDGDCPESCDDGDSCTIDGLTGSFAACSAACLFQPISTCREGDDCCPAGCNAWIDSDCEPVCGNGMLEEGESCDPPQDCPASIQDCQDDYPCTGHQFVGVPEDCSAECISEPITGCQDGDRCCPAGCSFLDDDDCIECGAGEYPCGNACCRWRIEIADEDCYRNSQLKIDSRGLIVLVCQHLNQAFRIKVWGGLAWNTTDVGVGEFRGYRPALSIDENDGLHVAFINLDDQLLSYARPTGAGWEIQPVLPLGQFGGTSRPMDIETDARGGVQLSFYQDDWQALLHTRKLGEEWDTGVVDTGPGIIGWQQDLAVDDAGRPHLCYLNRDDREIWYATHDGAAWQIERIAEWGSACFIDVDRNGAPHIAYSLDRTGVYHAVNRGAGWETHVHLQDATFNLFGIALDSQGVPHVAFRQNQAGQNHLMYARLNGSRWVIMKVDFIHSPFDGSGSIALDSQDRPYISYYEHLPNGQPPPLQTKLAMWQ